jgi:hypothetical protein
MIKSFLTHSQVIQGEPALDDYLRSDQINFDDIRIEAFSDMLKELIDQNLDMKLMCLPLVLQESATKTAAFTGEDSDIDYAQRTRLELKVTALTGDAVFSIEGTNDNETYETIDVISGSSISDSMAVTITGTTNYILTGVYKYYRLNLLSIGTTVTYSANLYENTYSIIHRELTRKKIYGSLMAQQGDVWAGKYLYYRDIYDSLLKTSKFYYDSDDDGDYSEYESERNLNVNVVFRP